MTKREEEIEQYENVWREGNLAAYRSLLRECIEKLSPHQFTTKAEMLSELSEGKAALARLINKMDPDADAKSADNMTDLVQALEKRLEI